MKAASETREQWLNAAVAEFTGYIAESTGNATPRVRVGIGFPSSGMRGSTLAECWTPAASADGSHEIIIRIDRMPSREQQQDILSTLLHEVCHAVAGIPAGHGPEFKKVAKAVGLVGKMTATMPSEELREALQDWVEFGSLGSYPMAAFRAPSGFDVHSGGRVRSHSGPGTQTTRMIKVSCRGELGCGYAVRVTRKWLEIAIPTCPNPECGNRYLAMQEG